MRHCLVTLLVVCAPALAAADDLAKYVGNVSDAKHYASCDMLVAPNGEVRRPCKLSLADLGASAGAKLTVKNAKDHTFPRNPHVWREADIEVRDGGKLVGTYHLVEIGSTNNADADFMMYAAHWIKLVPDNDAVAAAQAGKLATPKAIANYLAPDKSKSPDREAAVGEVEMYANKLFGGDISALASMLDEGEALVGSAPNQTLIGKAGGKQLRGWKMAMKRTGGLARGGNDEMAWGAFDIVGTLPADPKVKGAKPTSIPYVVMFVVTRFTTPGGAPMGEPALATFAIAP